MRNVTLCLSALLVLAVLTAAPAQAVNANIIGPEDIFVPFGQCVTVTWTASGTGIETYDWVFDGAQVGTASSYSRQFCSPGLSYATYSFHTLELWVTGGGQADYDSQTVHPIYEGGNDGGGCGILITC